MNPPRGRLDDDAVVDDLRHGARPLVFIEPMAIRCRESRSPLNSPVYQIHQAKNIFIAIALVEHSLLAANGCTCVALARWELPGWLQLFWGVCCNLCTRRRMAIATRA
jgi:hypothetical protein